MPKCAIVKMPRDGFSVCRNIHGCHSVSVDGCTHFRLIIIIGVRVRIFSLAIHRCALQLRTIFE